MIEALSQNLVLGPLLSELVSTFGGYDIVDHWQQGEFHHDLVLRLSATDTLPGNVLVVATNCNGGVKEILRLDSVPERSALWHSRCPQNPEFDGDLPAVLETVRTVHWFDPCELLGPDARSEYREEFRERVPGGGWRLRQNAAATCGR